MAIRYRPSDVSRGAGRGCAACADVQTDVVTGELRVQSEFGVLPGKADWPLLGCMYKSRDTDSSPFGESRRTAGLLGMKVLGPDNTSNVNVVNELGQLAYYVYTGSGYDNRTDRRNRLYSVAGGGWLELRDCGSYFEYDSNKRLISAFDVHGNAQYFYYDGSGDPQYVLNDETGRAVYFETDAGGRITEIKDWGGRQTTLSYDANANLNKVVGPSLCVTYFDYDASEDLVELTDSEGRTVYYDYDSRHHVIVERYGSAATYFNYGLGTGIYRPNGIDCDAWYGRDSDPVNSDLDDWQDHDYTPAQENTVSTDDANGVQYCNDWDLPPPPVWKHAGHEYLIAIAEDRNDVTKIEAKAKVYLESGEDAYLRIWNFNSTAWELLDSQSWPGSPQAATLQGSVTSNITNYINTSGYIYVLVHNLNDAGTCTDVRYVEVKITV